MKRLCAICGRQHEQVHGVGRGRRSVNRNCCDWLAAGIALLLAWVASPAAAVDVWITAGDKSQLLAQQPDVVFQPGVGTGGTQISVVRSATFQVVAGFGAAMTDSSAWLLQNRLTQDQRGALMRHLFSPQTGVGLNYLRVPIGASDFTAGGFYTYNDNPPGGSDELQMQFSVAHDDAYIVPRLQEARLLNPALRLMGSPWTAPAWMKTNNSLTGGSLAQRWEASYARYLAEFIQAYEARGLPIDAITVQNEPLHTSNYPTMAMPSAQQARLIGDHVGPHFAAEGITSKIIGYDHNWDEPGYPLDVLSDPEARNYLSGSAFHAYAGNVSAQSAVHNAYPDKGIYFTEITGGDWATNFADNLVWYSQNIVIGNMRNWGQTAILWNLALDQNGSPHLNGCGDCRGVVTINSSTGAITYNEEFYVLGQATKAVQPGAIRIGSSTTAQINTVAFENPDGSRVLLALNPNPAAASLRLYENGQHLMHDLPAKSLATFLWDADGADFDNGGFDLGGFQQGGGSLDAWRVFGNRIGNVSASDEAVLHGERALKLYGQFTGAANTSGASQGVTVAAGEVVRAQASALVRAADSIVGTGNSALMKIEFYSQYGADRGSAEFLSESEVTLADGGTPPDTWLSRGLVAQAPAGATEARLVLQFVQPSGQSGAVFVDDVTFSAAAAADFNGDGVIDGHDLDVWQAEFGSAGPAASDGDGDGDVDGADMLFWQQAAFAQAISLGVVVPECQSQVMAGLSGLAVIGCGGRPGRRHRRCG
ncbi:MAG: hypothetical protein IT424_16295 [Pirellulales bacterium]|nr:hypothetical protein [Pirellulales bacterium]